MKEDWDTLVILDACRFDMFERINDLPGTLESRLSRGSSTTEFLKSNFCGTDHLDTVYVTANPQLYWNRDKIDVQFHDEIHVWADEEWDAETGTVRPEALTERAAAVAERYPNKQLIVHYIQPHYPFLDTDTEFDKGHLEDPETAEVNLWAKKMSGRLDTSREQLWQLYEDNLRAVLPAVEDLLSQITGKTVITADHGNMVGDRAWPFPIREWGHPRGIYTTPLVKVPWLVTETSDRRRITEEERSTSADDTALADDIVTDRLADLGYV